MIIRAAIARYYSLSSTNPRYQARWLRHLLTWLTRSARIGALAANLFPTTIGVESDTLRCGWPFPNLYASIFRAGDKVKRTHCCALAATVCALALSGPLSYAADAVSPAQQQESITGTVAGPGDAQSMAQPAAAPAAEPSATTTSPTATVTGIADVPPSVPVPQKPSVQVNRATVAELDRVHQLAAKLKLRAMQQVAVLKGAALNRRFPLDTRVSVFLDISVPEYRIERAVVVLDGRRLGAYTYTRKQAAALQRVADSVHRIVRANVAPGPHRLSVRFRGHWVGDAPDAPAVVGSFGINFTKSVSNQLLILPVSPSALQPQPAQGAWQWEEDPEDARLGMVRFLRATGRRFEGLLDLLELQGSVANTADLPRGFFTLLAHSYIDLGIREQAYLALERARTRDDDQAAINAAVLRLATLEYKRDHYRQALVLLETIRTKLASRSQTVAWRDIGGRVLMAQGRFAQAVGVMDAIAFPVPYAPYIQHNLAVALIKSGAPEKGHDLLAEMGAREDRASDLVWAMRAKANLVLGFDYLRNGRGEPAREALSRIPWTSAFSTYALAGLGWSELAPGAPQKGGPSAESTGDDGGFHFGPFVFGGQDNEIEPRRALVAWNELATRAPLDLAVIEALIAKPYTLEQMGAYEQALSGYQHAIAVLKQDRQKLAEYAQQLKQARYREAVAYRDYSRLPRAAWMRKLIANHRFAQLQRNFHDLQLLQGTLLRLDALGTRELRNGLAYGAVQQSRMAQDVLAAGVHRQQRAVHHYLIQARLGIARVYEASRKKAAPEPESKAPVETRQAPSQPSSGGSAR